MRLLVRPARALLPALCALALAACSRADAIFVRDAKFAEADPAAALATPDSADSSAARDTALAARALRAVRGHRIAPGRDVVLGFRWYSSEKLWKLNDGRFRKVTVELPDSLLRHSGTYPLGAGSAVALRYSVGTSMRPERACLGGARNGHLRIWKGLFRSFRVEVEFDVAAVHPDGVPCRPEHFRKRFTPHRVRGRGITPWIGRAGRKPLDETAP